MTEQGAITLAIKALDKIAGQSCAGRNPEGDPYLIEAIEALKAFKDGVPEGLESAVATGRRSEIGQAAKDTSTWLTAAKHLQDGIK